MERMPKAGMSSADKAKYLGVTANTWRRMVRSGMPIVFFNVLFVLAMDLGQPTRTRWCVEYPHSTLNKTIFKFLQNEELYYRTLPGLKRGISDAVSSNVLGTSIFKKEDHP
jgi:hypothetical protein